jgi:hypothetical protein
VVPHAFDELAALWAHASALPLATVDHFRNREQFRAEFAPSFRRIDDLALRSELIRVGMAAPADVAPGRLPRTSIIRLTPHLEAQPSRREVASRGGRRSHTQPPANLPTVEDVRDFLAAIAHREDELLADLDQRVAALKADIARVDGERLYACVATLHRLLDERRGDARVTARRVAIAELRDRRARGGCEFVLEIDPTIGPATPEEIAPA